MKIRHSALRKAVLCFDLTVLFLSLFVELMPVTADTTNVYLTWQGKDSTIGGFLTICNMPTEFDASKTYQVNMTLSVTQLDYADAIEFKTINWFVRFNYPINQTDYQLLGYSVVDTNITKGGSDTFSSHWSTNDTVKAMSGILFANATYKLQNSTIDYTDQTFEISPLTKIIFKSNTRLTLYARIAQSDKENILRSILTEQGEDVIVYGTLIPLAEPTVSINNISTVSMGHAKIDLLYSHPKGEKMNHTVVTDNYGNFSDVFKTSTVGTWTVEAKYNGGTQFSSSTSNLVLLYVDYTFPLFLWLGLLFFVLILLVPWVLGKLYKKTETIKKKPVQEQPKESEQEKPKKQQSTKN